uniref:Secreted protein n=1 Tax=Panagrellus redivivus TaxID=6233 RepID=A0A7E4W979_PANRE
MLVKRIFIVAIVDIVVDEHQRRQRISRSSMLRWRGSSFLIFFYVERGCGTAKQGAEEEGGRRLKGVDTTVKDVATHLNNLEI